MRLNLPSFGDDQFGGRIQSASRSENLLRGISVFVVDDGLLQARMTAQILQAAGAWVFGPYGDPQSALRGIARQEPTCAILGAQFAAMPVFRIARALRDKSIPFFFMTTAYAFKIPPDIDDVIVLERPVDLPLLVDTVAIIAADHGGSPPS